MLLAVDLGLRTAWALYDRQGRLVRFESRHFGTRTRFRSGVPSVIRTLPQEIEAIVAEGDARLARIWFACRAGWDTEVVYAEKWRADIFWQRQRRSGPEAKEAALELAARVIKEDGRGWATSLNDDTAEAILLGRWAVIERGWRQDLGS